MDISEEDYRNLNAAVESLTAKSRRLEAELVKSRQQLFEANWGYAITISFANRLFDIVQAINRTKLPRSDHEITLLCLDARLQVLDAEIDKAKKQNRPVTPAVDRLRMTYQDELLQARKRVAVERAHKAAQVQAPAAAGSG